MTVDFRRQLLASTLLVGAAAFATPAFAQQTPESEEPVLSDQPEEATDDTSGKSIMVTGTRIARPNLTSNSPIAVVSGEQTVEQGDVTLDTYLNTLPQVNPAGTTTSNNPGNNAQANIDLRGMGANRNLVLIDGRRPMPSSSTQIVNLNTIPQGLIERVEVVTGGAGAAYGADAISGVVNFILRDDFEGIEVGASYSQSLPEMDSRDVRLFGTIGANLADGRGNVSFSVEWADREGLIKAQRGFAAQATSTTPTPPTGRAIEGTNPFPQATLNAVFATYGVPAAQVPGSGSSLVHFNANGTLFGGGTFNTPLNVANFRYDPLGLDGAAANQNYFPDFYSYNFDIINLLVLPLERKSAFLRAHYDIIEPVQLFIQAGFTEYDASTALAPTPVGVRIYNPANVPNATFATSPLVSPGGAATFVTGLVVPVTNPFIPTDLRTLLAARTGDRTVLTGTGATEPLNLAYRFLQTGLRGAGLHQPGPPGPGRPSRRHHRRLALRGLLFLGPDGGSTRRPAATSTSSGSSSCSKRRTAAPASAPAASIRWHPAAVAGLRRVRRRDRHHQHPVHPEHRPGLCPGHAGPPSGGRPVAGRRRREPQVQLYVRSGHPVRPDRGLQHRAADRRRQQLLRYLRRVVRPDPQRPALGRIARPVAGFRGVRSQATDLLPPSPRWVQHSNADKASLSGSCCMRFGRARATSGRFAHRISAAVRRRQRVPVDLRSLLGRNRVPDERRAAGRALCIAEGIWPPLSTRSSPCGACRPPRRCSERRSGAGAG